ncbi:hypothetical protein M0812_06808 [Anaeramoeba flamelloides]|uniref:START domain-containing protein n=1 Tax=Anaeramoeba flamelloides TaxID=1746091 RepID=A0AAV8AEM3_9EUKA|nr:hypothetical protein M0812_06808 [Anaeramoeba flamelloides]
MSKKKKKKKVKKKKITKEEREKKYKKIAYTAGEECIEVVLNEVSDKTLEWEEISSNQDVQLYKRDIDGFKVPKLKLVCMVPMANPEEVVSLTWTFEGRKKWDKKLKAIEILKTFNVEKENENLDVILFAINPPVKTMSTRVQIDVSLTRRTNDGKIISGRKTLEDSKMGLDTTKAKGKRGRTNPSGFVITPITRKQWIKYAKKSKTTRTINEGEDPDEIVASKFESIIFPDIGKNAKKMMGKMMIKVMSKMMPKSFTRFVDYVTTDFQQEKKKKSKKKKSKRSEKSQK